jgi:hypothetical protein
VPEQGPHARHLGSSLRRAVRKLDE